MSPLTTTENIMATAPHPTRQFEPSLYPALLPLYSDWKVADRLLSSDAMLPAQFYSPPDSTYKTRGESALMCAVLDDAINCFQKQFVMDGRRVQRLAREAEEWISSNDRSWPFSFINICEALGLDPEYLHLGVTRLRQHSSAYPLRQRRRPGRHRQPLKVAA